MELYAQQRNGAASLSMGRVKPAPVGRNRRRRRAVPLGIVDRLTGCATNSQGVEG
jgi:hypothetical protein